MAQQDHPIFDEIRRSRLEAVQQRVLADGAVLEARFDHERPTPIMYAIRRFRPTIELWLLEHRGQHNVDTVDRYDCTALHHAAKHGMLEVVQVLVAVGANPAALTRSGSTPLSSASSHGHTDIVAFLLQLPAVKASIDHINQYQRTALSTASYWGHQHTVQLLLDAGADPTIPAGLNSPINQAIRPRERWQPALTEDHRAIAVLLRHTIAEAARVRLGVALVGTKKKLCEELDIRLLEYLLPACASKGPAGV